MSKNFTSWDENSIVFYSDSLRATSGSQSLASLMNAFVKQGKKVDLITYAQPSGDDYISNEKVKRHFLNYYENQGYTLADSFYKILGEIPSKTVVFCGAFYEKTYFLFQAAQKLGRCIVIYQDRSPLISVAGGVEKQTAETLYMLQNADCVVSMSQQETEMLNAIGVNAVYQPYYFPYFDDEVGVADVSQRRIVFYTTYAGRNTRTVISAFSRLHERYPDSTLKIVIYKGVRQTATLEKLIEDVETSNLADCITIENKVLKPLRALREADVSITYAHLLHMPETAMESISAGIPAMVLYDADYSQDEGPAVKLNAADVAGIEAHLEYFMDEKNRRDYAQEVRKLLEPTYREKKAAEWLEALKKIEADYEAKLDKIYDRYTDLAEKAKKTLDSAGISAVIKEFFMDRATADETIAALVENKVSVEDIEDGYQTNDLFAKVDYKRVAPRLAVWKEYGNNSAECQANLKKSKLLPSNAVIQLSVCKTPYQDIAKCLPGVVLDEKRVVYILSQSMKISKGLADTRSMEADLSEDFTAKSPMGVTILNSFKLFMFENMRLFRYKNFKIVQKAMRVIDWYTKPFKDMNIFGKLVALPFRAIKVLKDKIKMSGRKRLAKEKIVEIDPGDIRKIQLMVLKIALDFDKICRKHGLRYYLAGGTILGGIRHKGFIPWDDDMDITMPRPDYEKFLQIAKTELPDEYVMDQDCKPFFHNRIEYKDSAFDTYWRKGGIFLDILALEGCPDDDALRLEHEKKCKYWRTAMLEQARRMPVFTFEKAVTRVYFRRLICKLTPRWFIKKMWHKWATKYDCNETSTWVCLPASIYTYEQERFPVEYWGEGVPMEFEGYEFPTMNHWEDYLICHFGNYMKMPPETLRKSHHFVYKYDLGKYKNMSVEEMEKMLDEKKANNR